MIKALLKDYPLKEGMATWDKWVSVEHRGPEALLKLIYDQNIPDYYKMRAVSILLAPSVNEIPCAWNGEDLTLGSCSDMTIIELDKLSINCMYFAEQLILYSSKFIDDDNCWGKTKCNKYYLQLFELVTDSMALFKIWPYFQMNDVMTAYGIEGGHSGYRPWCTLMANEKVSSIIKHFADDKILDVIQQEECGDKLPRVEWERAEECYVNHVSSILMHNNNRPTFPYDLDLLAKQINYIISIRQGNIKSYVIQAAAKRLAGLEKHKKLYDRLISLVI